MGFASAYLKERALFHDLIKEAPSENTGIIVVVPSYNEPEITNLLDSLYICTRPACDVEVFIVVNAPAGASASSLEINRQTIINVKSWQKEHSDCFFKLFIIDIPREKYDGWGVGMARKTGMDEALRRFNQLNNPEGIILNLDADCTVQLNYFTAVYAELSGRKERSGCSIYFEHPTSGKEFPLTVYKAIIQYELHLRYYFQALAFTGFPYVHHTVGSAIAVKALSYVKAGGMNRKKAGEDFYFIQKLVPAGGYFNLYKTTVYPSPRTSFRVPFGTGPTVFKLTETKNEKYLTYNFQAFRDVKSLFSNIKKIFLTGFEDQELCYNDLPESLILFIGIEEWREKITEIKRNTSGFDSFSKRFFGWFNMFKIVKYLNSVHSSYYEKKPVFECAAELLVATGSEFKSEDAEGLLRYFRAIEQGA